jgi:hypothetical protein
MARNLVALVVLVAVSLGAGAGAHARQRQDMTFLDNGVVRVGVSLVDGGKITFVGKAQGESRDLVQDIQPSHYSGRCP